MPRHSETRFLPFTPDQLFDLVADVDKYPQFLPWCVAARIRSRTERELVADLTIGFGGSIFLSSPFLILLFRKRVCSYPIVIAAWTAIVVLTLALWLHANLGGWQFSYRYGMILLPWMFLILLDNGGEKTSALEVGLFVLSVMINAYATYLFSWTDYVQP